MEAITKQPQQAVEQFAWANKIVRTYWDVKNVYTKRILAEYSRTIDKEDTEFYFKKIPISVLTEKGEVRDAMRQKKFLESLRKDGVTFKEKNGNLVTFSIFRGKITFNKAEDCFEVCPNQDLKDYFFGLQNKITILEYNEYMKLPSNKYQTMYEVLKSYSHKQMQLVEWDENTRIPGYSERLETLHFYLGSCTTSQKNYAAFARDFLKPMRDYMLKHTELFFDFKPYRAGKRKYTHVMFIFDTVENLKKKQQAAAEQKQKAENLKVLAEIQAAAEAQEAAEILKPLNSLDAMEIAAVQRKIEREKAEED